MLLRSPLLVSVAQVLLSVLLLCLQDWVWCQTRPPCLQCLGSWGHCFGLFSQSLALVSELPSFWAHGVLLVLANSWVLLIAQSSFFSILQIV